MIPQSRPLWQRFAIFLVPLMAANILQALSGTVSAIYVGQMIGVDALAAIATFFPILFFLLSFLIGLSSGSTVLIGQAWGARNIDKVKQVAGTTLITAFAMGVVVAVVGVIWTEQILSVLGVPADIAPITASYARIMLASMPGFFLFIVATSVLRGVGDTMTPLFSLILSLAVTSLVTPALIQGWFGLPQLGVNAAAVASISGFVTVLVFLFVYLRARALPLAPDGKLLAAMLKPDFKLLGLILRLGVPAGLQMVVSSVSGIVVVGLVNRFGSEATAAYGALGQVMSYVQFPAMSIGIAASIFGAQAIGAGKSDQLGAITRTGLMMNGAVTGTLVLIAYLFSDRLIALFITDPAVAPMVLSLICILGIELPGAIVLSQTGLGLSGIWVAMAAGFTMMLVLQGAWYGLVWRKKTITALI